MDYCKILSALFERFAAVRDETPSAGTRYRLMGLEADTAEVTEAFRHEVLERVKQEAVIDVDVDVDYTEMSEQVLTMELENPSQQDEAVRNQTQQVNDALGELSSVLAEIATQLERKHKDDEYERLYEQEKRRYMSSGTARRARQKYEEWKENQCNGQPTQEDMEDYRLEKLVHMFEKGVFTKSLEHVQRAKRYPGEIDFDMVDDSIAIKKTAYRHYAALRKLDDFKDGMLLVNAVRAGRHFFFSRHDENAKPNRSNFLKYMHKVWLVQEDMRRLQEAEAAAAARVKESEKLNFFAPKKNLQIMLADRWFGAMTTDDQCYTTRWTDAFVDALMRSEWGEQLARDWAVQDKRLTLKCMIIGLLKDADVLHGSYNQIAKLLDFNGENAATLAKYMGQGKKQLFADWVMGYVKSHSETDPTE